MSKELGYKYGADYPYLVGTLENSKKPKHQLRVAVRDYFRVFFPLGLKPGDTILDVGSCIGTMGHFFKYAGITTYGVDLNPAAVVAGRELYGNERHNQGLVGDALALPLGAGRFDAVVSQDILEHIVNPVQALREMERVLKPGRGLMFHKITVKEDKAHIDDDDSHVTKWSTEEWVSFFESCGWNAIQNPTRKFPIASNISYGNFLVRRIG